MTQNIVISGYYLGLFGKRYQLPLIHNPKPADADLLLSMIKNRHGVLEIKDKNQPDSGFNELILYAENERYLIMLGEFDDDGEWVVRTLKNLDYPPGLSLFHGEMFPNRAVTTDFALIRRLFEECITTGNISRDILN